MSRACDTYRRKRNSYVVLIDKSEGNILPGRRRHRREDNIKMDVMKTEWRVWTAFI
jgi:hypothetical protein